MYFYTYLHAGARSDGASRTPPHPYTHMCTNPCIKMYTYTHSHAGTGSDGASPHILLAVIAHMYTHTCTQMYIHTYSYAGARSDGASRHILLAVMAHIPGTYGVPGYVPGIRVSRLLKILRLFCKRALWKRQYSAKETYNFKEPTNRSHPIPGRSSHISNFLYLCHVVHRIESCLFMS